MKTKHLTHRERKASAWSRNHWLLAVLIAFIGLVLLGLVLFLFFPNRAI